MSFLPSKYIKDFQEIYLQNKYGLSGKIIASIMLFFILIGVVTSIIVAITPFIEKKEEPLKQGTLGTQHVPSLMPAVSLTPIPTPMKECDKELFSILDWESRQYSLRNDGYLVPNNDASHKFFHPFLQYRNKITANFKKVHITYEATSQDYVSTASAMLYISLSNDHRDKIFEIDLPQPNRKMIGLKKVNINGSGSISMTPIILDKPMAMDKTHSITITSVKLNGNNLIYYLHGEYVDTNGIQRSYDREIPVSLPTVDPYFKENTLSVGTGKKGMLKIKRFTMCDRE
jgi:hypothetical protein